MSKDLLTAKLQTLKEVVTPLFSIEANEIGKFSFDTEAEDFESDDNPFGKFITGRTRYSMTLKGMGAVMLLLDPKKEKSLKTLAPNSDSLYSNKEFATLRKYVQDHEDMEVSSTEFRCIGHVNIMDRDTGALMLNTRNYKGDREYFKKLREIKEMMLVDPEKDYSAEYAEAKKALLASDLRSTGSKTDYAKRPIFVIKK